MVTANPAELERITTRLEERWGKDAVSKVVRFVNGTLTAAGIGTAGAIPVLGPLGYLCRRSVGAVQDAKPVGLSAPLA